VASNVLAACAVCVCVEAMKNRMRSLTEEMKSHVFIEAITAADNELYTREVFYRAFTNTLRAHPDTTLAEALELFGFCQYCILLHALGEKII
jgi:hypothetical protein